MNCSYGEAFGVAADLYRAMMRQQEWYEGHDLVKTQDWSTQSAGMYDLHRRRAKWLEMSKRFRGVKLDDAASFRFLLELWHHPPLMILLLWLALHDFAELCFAILPTCPLQL